MTPVELSGRNTTPPTCAICHERFSSTDAVVYLGVEKVLMHRACCGAHPSCRCEPEIEPMRLGGHVVQPLLLVVNDHGAANERAHDGLRTE